MKFVKLVKPNLLASYEEVLLLEPLNRNFPLSLPIPYLSCFCHGRQSSRNFKKASNNNNNNNILDLYGA